MTFLEIAQMSAGETASSGHLLIRHGDRWHVQGARGRTQAELSPLVGRDDDADSPITFDASIATNSHGSLFSFTAA